MKRLLAVLVALGFLLMGTYGWSVEESTQGEFTIAVEKKGEKKAPAPTEEEGEGAEVPGGEEAE